jgi:hypothetical protein
MNVTVVGPGSNATPITPLVTGELVTQPSRTNPGYVEVLCERDSGSVTGSAEYRQVDATNDYQMRVGVDVVIDNLVANATAQNTARLKSFTNVMTLGFTNTGIVTNNAGSTANNAAARISSNRQFNIYGASEVWAEFQASFTDWNTTNTTIDVGIFQAATSPPYAPTDGVYFRATSTGMYGVVNSNGTETVVGPFLVGVGGAAWTPTINNMHKFAIGFTQRDVEFWIDDVLYNEVDTFSLTGQPFTSGSLPFSIRHAVGGGTAGAVQKLKIADYTVSMSGFETSKPWAHQLVAAGMTAHQGQDGGTMGSTTGLGNSSAIPTTAAGSNTAANLTGFGGLGQMTAAAGAATDFIATDFVNPVGGVGQTARQLYITGCTVSAINYGAAVATTPTTLFWSLAFGHTATSLATGEATATKAPRLVPLGFMSAPVGAAVGAAYSSPITVQFSSPIPVGPGEHIASVVRQLVGTATASQTIVYSVSFDGYYE